MKTYTHTEEGKSILNLLGNIINTNGMEIYECKVCDEKFAGRPEEMKDNTCGLCEEMIKAENFVPGEDQ